MNTSFTGFKKRDFAAFARSKREDGVFNVERKVVWEKMKKLQMSLEVELEHRDFPLKGKISQYWINYTKRRVNGIWLAYTDIEPYYIVCQLNCGIYRDGFFVGIEINPKARDHLENAAKYISQNKKEFLLGINRLDPKYFRFTYGSWVARSNIIKLTDLKCLLNTMHSERDWFELGEWYPRTENFLTTNQFISKIPEVFEKLLPLYFVFAGKRPLGKSKKEKLLRLNDAQKEEFIKIEKKIASEINTFDTEHLDELISEIDKRNESKAPKRLSHSTRKFRRNPVLSAALKKKYGDRCQVCAQHLPVSRGFFCDTHHLKPLNKGGLDISENILVLCPNHHRFFDRSKVKIMSQDQSLLVIQVGEKILKITRGSNL